MQGDTPGGWHTGSPAGRHTHAHCIMEESLPLHLFHTLLPSHVCVRVWEGETHPIHHTGMTLSQSGGGWAEYHALTDSTHATGGGRGHDMSSEHAILCVPHLFCGDRDAECPAHRGGWRDADLHNGPRMTGRRRAGTAEREVPWRAGGGDV